MNKNKVEQVGAKWDSEGNVWRVMSDGNVQVAKWAGHCGQWCRYDWDEEAGEWSDCPVTTLNFGEAVLSFCGPCYSHGELIGYFDGDMSKAIWVPDEHTVGFPIGG